MRSIGILPIILLTVTLGCARSEPLRGQQLDPPREVPDLSARDHRGQVFRFKDQRGKVVLVFFGYTTCPDVCPATLALWQKVYQRLGRDSSRVRFVFVTVDPERDTAPKVKEYLALFNPEFVGLVGTEQELRPIYRAFGAVYEKVPQPKSVIGYLVAHTATVSVVDAQGRWRLRLPPDTSVEDYLHDLQILLREAH